MFFFKFKHKPKPPLETAIHMVNNATQIAHLYQHDRKHRPSEKELKLLEELAEMLFRNYSMVQRIIRNLNQRARGEPEGPAKFTNPSRPWI